MQIVLRSVAAVIVMVFSLGLASANAATVISPSGVTNVKVGSVLYDVAFVNGSCSSVFGGCNELSDFDFATQEASDAAMNVLRDILNAAAKFYPDFSPNGCTYYATCVVITPYANVEPQKQYFLASVITGRMNQAWSSGSYFSYVEASDTFETFARWTAVAPVPVPVPASGILLAAGLGGFAALSRRKARSA